ncbi:hypothetical protein OE749_16980 [Aestuariibacter sp. AA17]|uniref:Zinc-finger domain-containing protein n=1 Tax=Fluctibacter corallii TaxID=2984329 RepID=A0ABT3ACJ0_9ALTE|nr:hypothetical protein [Aestuariibacter sp. AA17]MCV2886391.1 hypothetical protein [Aestuariibacter sp. AA17]
MTNTPTSEFNNDLNDLLHRYHKGMLTPEEEIEFETRLISDPALLHEMEIEALLHKYMPEVQKLRQPVTSKVASIKSRISQYSWQALAASILVFSLSGSYVFKVYHSQNDTFTATSSVVFLETVRSSSQPMAVFKKRPGAESLLVFWQTRPLSKAQYTIDVTTASTTESVYSTTINVTDEHGEIAIMLPTDKLHGSEYQIRLFDKQKEIIAESQFKIE